METAGVLVRCRLSTEKLERRGEATRLVLLDGVERGCRPLDESEPLKYRARQIDRNVRTDLPHSQRMRSVDHHQSHHIVRRVVEKRRSTAILAKIPRGA
ncbi:MAG: hypothetical protein ACXVHJ_35445, partial [Solirubrobacteraceae bacterium]